MALSSHHGGSVYISCSDNIRCGFGSHLYASFRREKITITNDEAFLAETPTKLAREDAIRKSNIVIIIISKEYPRSKDCLDELEIIRKYGEKKEILSACYHISSEDIRYQTGSFKNAFIELESKFPEQMVKIWRNGFVEVVAKAKAYKVNIGSDESGIVQDITRDVSSMMKCVCSLDAQGLNDAILQPTTTHRTSSMPVSGDLSKKKQIADVKVGKLGPQATSCRTSLVPSVSVTDAASSTHKMFSRNNQTASTSSSFSDVNHDVDWQTLAKDCLIQIVKKLHAHDFAIFSTVCEDWRSACSNLKWFLDPPHPLSIHFQGQNIMNHLDDGKYVLERREIDGRHYYSCVHGWILNTGSINIHIFNLFSMAETSLPMLSRVGYLRHIVKFILFKACHGDNLQFSVVALFGRGGFIAFKGPRFQHWIYIQRRDDIARCIDVVLFRGRFYALCDRGNLFQFVFYRSNIRLSLVATQLAGSSGDGRYYLVKNVDHLIAVFQKGEVGFGGKRFDTETFRIYRLDITTTWTRISEPDYLKGRALFISSGNSWTIDPAEVESCRRDSIYFTDDYWLSNNRDGHFIGVFDIANGTIEDFQFEMDQYPPNDVSPFSSTDNVGA